jgi:hypothetical protein
MTVDLVVIGIGVALVVVARHRTRTLRPHPTLADPAPLRTAVTAGIGLVCIVVGLVAIAV